MNYKKKDKRNKIIAGILLCLIIVLVGVGYFSRTEYRANNHYKKGLTALNESKPAEAVIEFKNAVKLNPDHTDALYQLGAAYLKLGGPSNLQNGYKTFSNLASKKPERLDAQLKLGEMLLLGNNIKEASEKADFILKRDPKNAEGHLFRARIFGKERQFDKAKSEYQKALDLNPKMLSAYHEWATILLMEKKNKEAEDLLHKAVLVDPKSLNNYFALAGFYQLAGEIKSAEEQYQKAIEAAPKNKLGYFMLARFYLSQKKNETAEAALISATEIDKEDDEPFLTLGNFYFRQNQFDKAEKRYLSAKSAQPKSGRGGKKLALLYLAQSKTKEASSEIESLLEAREDDRDAIFLKGRLLLLDKKGALAIEQFKKLLLANATYPEAHYYLGVASLVEGHIEEGKTAFLDAVKNVPSDIRSHFALAKLYMQSRAYDLAIPEANLVLKSDPNNVQAMTLLADIALIQKKVPNAEGLSQKILALTPKNQSALYRMGVVRRIQRKQDEAMMFFEKVLSENINAIEPLSQVVAIHLENKKPEKAMSRVAQQIGSAPKNPRFYALEGRLYGGMGQLDKAEESFKKGILADARFLDTYVDLGRVYLDQKKFDQGIAQLDNAIKIDPKYLPAYMLKGAIHDFRGNWGDARVAYEKVMELNPHEPVAANNLAWIYAEQGVKIDRALELAMIAKEKSPNDPLISDTLGWIYYKKEFYLKAISLLKESVEKVPKNPIIHYHLGMSYAKRGEAGDKKMAQQSLQKALAIDPKFSGSDIAKKTLESL